MDEDRSSRRRKMTEKGLQHVIETKAKNIASLYRQLKRTFEEISPSMSSDSESKEQVESVRKRYSSWLKLYDSLYCDREEFGKLLDESEKIKFFADCAAQDQVLVSLKHTAEKYFIQYGPLQRSESEIHSVISSKERSIRSKGSRGTNVSSISSAQLEEKQKQAELLAISNALKEKQQLELDQMKIMMKEEQLDIQTQLEVSKAKSRVLDSFEKGLPVQEHSVVEQRGEQKPSDGDIIEQKPTEDVPAQEPTGKDTSEQELTYSNVAKQQSTNRAGDVTKQKLIYRGVPDEHIDRGVLEQEHLEGKQVSPCALYKGGLQLSTEPQDSHVIDSIVKNLRKPVADIHKFSGDPLDYPKFMRQFRAKVVANCESDDEMMSYLEQYTVGEAHKVVAGFSYLSASVGYNAALAELDERYGNEDSLSNALIKKALDWPCIKPDNAKALDEFGIFLSECDNAVRSIPAVKVLEYPDNLRKLVTKLPFHHHDKWRNVILQIKDTGRHVQFKDLALFVKKEARKAMDPMYGREALRMSDNYKPNLPRKPKTKASFSTHAHLNKASQTEQKVKGLGKPELSVATKPCLYCGRFSHCVASCEELTLKPHSDRLAFIRSRALCFRCLGHGHISTACEFKASCAKCQQNHQTLLHMEPKSDKMSSACTETCGAGSASTEAGNGESTLAIISIMVSKKGGNQAIKTYAFLDPGSTVSFCSESLLKRLGCSGKKTQITIDTMGTRHTSNVYAINGLQVHDRQCNNIVPVPTLYSKNRLPVSKKHIPTSDDIACWSHLADVPIAQTESDVDLLIGCNVPDAYSPLEVRTGPDGSPHATRTRLGWILWNVVRPMSQCAAEYPVMRTEMLACKAVEEMRQLDKAVKDAMNYDFPEKVIDDRKEMSQDDKRFMDMVSESICLRDGHYFIKLSFKSSEVQMPDNHDQALSRLLGLKKRFVKDENFHLDYVTFMDKTISAGYAEEVPSDQREGCKGRVWYIPHHGVYHPRKKDKIRVAFDCAVTYQGVSLNSALLQGPDLTTSLLGILLRFREQSTAVMADIESMYYQVCVPREDCDFLRFFWWPNDDFTQEPKIYRMLVHLFGAVSSASCASFALQQTAKDNQDLYDAYITNMIKTNFYVDDYLASNESEQESIHVVKDITSLCSKGGFRLTKWVSNSHEVMKSIPVEERETGVKHLDLDSDQLPSERALGVYWSVESDALSFSVLNKQKPSTRRGILSVIGTVYDPLGMVAPYILVAKILLQKLCRICDWDEEIDKSSLKLWNDWIADLPKLENIQLDRCYMPHVLECIMLCQLHVFADASENGYGVVIYLRFVDQLENVRCNFVLAKSRVAPLKKITMP